MATSKAIWDNDEAEETIDGEAVLLQDRNSIKSQLQLMPLVDLDAAAENRHAKNSNIECGYCGWRSKCLRRCNNPPCLLFFLSLCALTLGFVVNGVNNVNTTAIERRFNLPSAKVGLISSAYDISAAILGIIISYFGARKYKARIVGISIIVASLGSFLMALPHFTIGPYQLGTFSTVSACLAHETNSSGLTNSISRNLCQKEMEGHLSNYLYLLILGQLLHGVGGTTLYTVGVALLDDSVPPSSTPLYLGILYSSAVIGPGLGYVVGGQFLSLYVDFNLVTARMEMDDPRWVGAWWLGFLIAACLNLLVAIPVCGFGAELPSAQKIRQNRISQAHCERKKVNTLDSDTKACLKVSRQSHSFHHFIRVTWSLLCNPCFFFMSLSMVTEGIALSGVATFMPKMIENKFRASASWAAVLSGIAVVPSAATGQFLGGYIAKRKNLGIPGLIKLSILGMALTLVFSAVVWNDCEPEEYVGIASPYFNSSSDVTDLVSECNRGCGCTTEVFIPVCDENKTLYFSPCHAGCSMQTSEYTYSNCSCLGPTAGTNATVSSRGCRQQCAALYPFIAQLFLLICFNMICVAPGDAVQLRCVPEEDKTYAQGLKLLIVRSLGTVAGPIIIGRLLDNTCVVWRTDCKGSSLSCWLYNIFGMTFSLYVTVVVTKVFSIFFCLMALALYRPPVPAHEQRTDKVVVVNIVNKKKEG